MARDRQRAKQRQAQRRAARLAERDAGPDGAERDAQDGRVPEGESATPENRGVAAPGDPALEPALAAGAPREEVGRSDAVLEAPAEPDPDLEPELDEDDPELEAEAAAAEPAAGPRGRRGEAAERAPARGRIADFLVAVVAELRRVEWPNRQTLTTLTGVVLVFVVLVGLYLGALDAVFSKLINAIL